MSKWGELLMKRRNAFLLILLATTLLLSGYARQQETKTASTTVNIPVVETAAQQLSPLERYRQQRDQETLDDIASLEALVSQPLLDEATREAAAERLQQIIDCRQARSALEGALVSSKLGPCVAVISGGSLTIVTSKADITQSDSALVMTLAQAHAGIEPANVQIITAN